MRSTRQSVDALSFLLHVSYVAGSLFSSVGPDVPQIDVTPYTMTERGYSALERETVSLLCQAQSNPASQYVWFYNNSQVYTGPQLTITKILRMHTGDYACLVQNMYLNTRSKKTISLTVYCECENCSAGNPLRTTPQSEPASSQAPAAAADGPRWKKKCCT